MRSAADSVAYNHKPEMNNAKGLVNFLLALNSAAAFNPYGSCAFSRVINPTPQKRSISRVASSCPVIVGSKCRIPCRAPAVLLGVIENGENAASEFEADAAGASKRSGPKPITGPWPEAFPAKGLCSNCGLCLTSTGVKHVSSACAFIGDGMSRAESLESQVHGRSRSYSQDDLSEAHFGVHERILLARGNVDDAQWTGVTTGIALAWLESGAVDAVVVAGSKEDAEGFAAPTPLLCRTPDEVLKGRRVKPSLCPSLAVLDEVKADDTIKRLLFCGVGCAVQALRSVGSADKVTPEQALGLVDGGLFVLGTHCVDNSPTPEQALKFVATLPSVGEARAKDVKAYEFMADFRVHARVGISSGGEETVKDAYMTLPPNIGVPSIADSCYSCFDYTNGLADLVIGYMGAPFSDQDEMTTAALMVTVRNAKGSAMLENAIAKGRVEVLKEGGHGGKLLPSTGDRRTITMSTVKRDSLVQTLTDPAYTPGDKGAPKWVGDILAKIISKGLPTGMEFARYSIDYHYLRNQVFVDQRMGLRRAARHVPSYAEKLMEPYAAEMEEIVQGPKEKDSRELPGAFTKMLSKLFQGKDDSQK